MSDKAILSIQDISRYFGGLAANRNITIEVYSGEILGLIGPNGAGKSTLFNLIAGAFPPSAGKILLENRDITSMSDVERCALGIARTFQVPRSFDSMTVLENVIVGALARQSSTSRARELALDTLDFVGLSARAQSSAASITPSEKRRLELARALATEPKLLLLDEVMTGLTPSEAQAGARIIKKIRELGITIVMVEHVMEIVMPLVDRAIVLNLGAVLAQGKPAEVVLDRQVINAYLGDRHHAA